MRIAFVTPYVPSLVRVRPYNFIKSLAREHEVTLVTLCTSRRELSDLASISRLCRQVEYACVPRARSLLSCLLALPTSLPLQAAYCLSKEMERLVDRVVSEQRPDVLHVEHLRAAHFGLNIHALPKVYDAVDCLTLLQEKTLVSTKNAPLRWATRLDLPRTRRYEAQIISEFDQVLVTAERDREALEGLPRHGGPRGGMAKAPVRVLQNGVDLEYFTPLGKSESNQDIVFSGRMSYHANVDAATFLCREIMPLVWASEPRARLWIVGSDPPKKIRQLADDERVHVTGYVEDMRPYVGRCAVAVCPVRYGVGIQNKALEAMAMGIPVVASPEACAAVAEAEGQGILVAREASEFAELVLCLLCDKEKQVRMGTSGRAYVEAHHDWNVIAKMLATIYAGVAN